MDWGALITQSRLRGSEFVRSSGLGIGSREAQFRRVTVACMEHERCTACGFDGGAYDRASLLDSLRALGARWRDLLNSSGSSLRVRPDPAVWSAIEYAAHSRDITALHAFGIEQALKLDEPAYPQLADDLIESAAATYCDDDPNEVVRVLDPQAGFRMASLAEGVGVEKWNRGLTIGDSRTDVRWLLEHGLHDSLHHLDDVEAWTRASRKCVRASWRDVARTP